MGSGSGAPTILVIGAGGGMTAPCLEALAPVIDPGVRFVLADLDPARLERPVRALGAERCRTLRLDLRDERGLGGAVARADLVVHGAGPYRATAAPVRRACLAHRRDYLDLDDDASSALEAIALDGEARAAGIRLWVGCGASPGITNVLARELLERVAEELDPGAPLEVEVAWCVGDEGGVELGRSVIEHTLHLGHAEYVGWRKRRPTRRRSWKRCKRFPLPGLERHPFYECAHPEPVMLGRTYPTLEAVSCLGSLHPAGMNGVLRGVARAMADGRLTGEEAVTFLQAAIARRHWDKGVERIALAGVGAMRRRGEISLAEQLLFAAGALVAARYRLHAGIGARVRTGKGSRRVEWVSTSDYHVRHPELLRMDRITGLAEAAFLLLALEGSAPPGCRFPEDWVEPRRFHTRLEALVPWARGSLFTRPRLARSRRRA